jgi:PAS domain S-box-containing protein
METSEKARLLAEIEQLQAKLQDAEDLIEAIRNGRIDALVVHDGEDRDNVYTLKGADHTYRILIESMDEGALVLSDEGAILYCNRRMGELLGVPANHITGHAVTEFFEPPASEKFRALHDRAFKNGGGKTEINLLSAGGEPVPTLVSLRTLPMDGFKVLCMVVTDLTEQKKTEATLTSYSRSLVLKNAELERRTAQLARLSSELTMAEQRERKQMSKLLHDGLQQLLASARLQLDNMAGKLPAEPLKEAVKRIVHILSESIRMSRSLSVELSPPILHDAGLAGGLEWLARSMREKHDMKVEIDSEAFAEPAEDIKFMAFDAVRELLFNAVKHARASGARVLVRQDGENRLRITVRDEGVGFDASRLDSGPGEEGGYGLFSIRERISLIGGNLEIDSTPGEGSRFTLVIPGSVKSCIEISEEIGSVRPAEEAPVGKNGIRVLVVDDHTLFRDGIADILSREPDIEVVGKAADGREAIDLARMLAPEVILMDISMPGVDGIEATTAIHREHPEIRIIGLSMHEDPELVRVMFQAGAVDYRNKDCGAKELLSAVRG